MPCAYVDGSYNIATKQFGYGVVFFTDNVNEDGEADFFTLSKSFSEPELAKMRNVAGEIMGAAQAMKSARARGYKSIIIYHDYEGIAKWCTGEWQTKKTWTKKYKDFYDEISKDLSVTFKKVEAHSGNKYNDLADRLAKEAVGNK